MKVPCGYVVPQVRRSFLALDLLFSIKVIELAFAGKSLQMLGLTLVRHIIISLS